MPAGNQTAASPGSSRSPRRMRAAGTAASGSATVSTGSDQDSEPRANAC
jgi:hypothetical protein